MDTIEVPGSISTMFVEDDEIVLGLSDGNILQYRISASLQYDLEYSLHGGHTDSIIKVKNLTEGRLFSCSRNDGNIECHIWTKHSGDYISLELKQCYTHTQIYDVLELADNLIVVAMGVSPAWDVFHVFDSLTGDLLYKDNCRMHRTHGVSLARTSSGHLSVIGDCEYQVHIWKVTREECTELNNIDGQRLTAITSLPTGEIVTSNYELELLDFNAEGKGGLVREKLRNPNWIDGIFPLGGYKILTVDRGGANSGYLRIWDLLANEDDELLSGKYIGSVQSVIGEFGIAWTYFDTRVAAIPRFDLLLLARENKVLIKKFEGKFKGEDELAEVRKNARILAQAQRVQPETDELGIGSLPEDILLKIIVLTGNRIKYGSKAAFKAATLNFCRPGQLPNYPYLRINHA